MLIKKPKSFQERISRRLSNCDRLLPALVYKMVTGIIPTTVVHKKVKKRTRVSPAQTLTISKGIKGINRTASKK